MEDCKPLSTSLDCYKKILRNMSPQIPKKIKAIKDVPDLSIISNLVYAMIGTLANITYVIQVISQYIINPFLQH